MPWKWSFRKHTWNASLEIHYPSLKKKLMRIKKLCFLTLTLSIYQFWIKILLGKLKRLYRYVPPWLQLFICLLTSISVTEWPLYTLMQLPHYFIPGILRIKVTQCLTNLAYLLEYKLTFHSLKQRSKKSPLTYTGVKNWDKKKSSGQIFKR